MLKTYTGREFNFLEITKESIHIPDILHALPSINRFLGHSSRPYSVGEHTVLGLVIAQEMGYTPLQQLHWFIHDFTEAYVGDCPTPLKRLLPDFSIFEEKVEMAILEYLELEAPTEEEYKLCKRVDETMLVLEMRDLTKHDSNDYISEYVYKDILSKLSLKNLDTITTSELRKGLTECFNDLMKKVKGEDFKCLEI